MTAPHITLERGSAMLAVIKEFQSLSPADMAMIAQRCRWHHYGSCEDVVRYQEHTATTFFIIQGEIRVTFYSSSGHEVILCDLSAGEMFGELTAIDGEARSALVVTKTDSIVASMSAPDFLNLLQSNPQVSLAILKRLTGQIRRLTDRVYDYSTLPVADRIHVELLRLAKPDTVAPNRGVISPAPTDTDMANFLSTHREAVNRELNKLVHEGLIVKKGHELRILDMAKLRKMVQEARGCE